ITDGYYFDVLPLPRASVGPWTLPFVEQSETVATRIFLSNPGTVPANITMFLIGPDGTAQSTYNRALDPNQQSAESFNFYFPAIAATFQGYVSVWTDQPITVSEEMVDATTRAAMNGQIATSTQPATMYAARLGNAAGVTILNLINSSTANATVTIQAYSSAG